MQVWTDTNWTLIISIIAGSAALAYAGDVLGFKYGKQRISIFGLRPRYTSRLITAFTGMLISLVVLIILSFFSENVRAALFQMKSLQQESKILSAQLQETALSLDITRFDMEALRKDRDVLFSEKRDLEARVLFLRDEAEELRRDLEIIRLGAITVQSNSILAQQTIPPRTPQKTVKEIITLLKKSARETVAAKRSEQRSIRANDVILIITETEEAELTAQLTNSPDRLYARILAAENIAMDENVTIRLESGVSNLLYDEGETVHRKLVRPIEPDFNAEDALHVFLRELKTEVIRNGVRPDPATNSVGSLEGEDFFEIVENLKNRTNFTVINAVALQPIYTEGPVKIQILLE